MGRRDISKGMKDHICQGKLSGHSLTQIMRIHLSLCQPWNDFRNIIQLVVWRIHLNEGQPAEKA